MEDNRIGPQTEDARSIQHANHDRSLDMYEHGNIKSSYASRLRKGWALLLIFSWFFLPWPPLARYIRQGRTRRRGRHHRAGQVHSGARRRAGGRHLHVHLRHPVQVGRGAEHARGMKQSSLLEIERRSQYLHRCHKN
jgi:hypothetical protein